MKKKSKIIAGILIAISLISTIPTSAAYLAQVVNTYTRRHHVSGYMLRENYTYKDLSVINGYYELEPRVSQLSLNSTDIFSGIWKKELVTMRYKSY